MQNLDKKGSSLKDYITIAMERKAASAHPFGFFRHGWNRKKWLNELFILLKEINTEGVHEKNIKSLLSKLEKIEEIKLNENQPKRSTDYTFIYRYKM
jgi:hypothetical protein